MNIIEQSTNENDKFLLIGKIAKIDCFNHSKIIGTASSEEDILTVLKFANQGLDKRDKWLTEHGHDDVLKSADSLTVLVRKDYVKYCDKNILQRLSNSDKKLNIHVVIQ